MRMCVQYAVDYPDRFPSETPSLDLFALGRMSFARPDTDTFTLLTMAKRAFFEGGACPAVLNAADEVAVDAFLKGRISFASIPRVVIKAYEAMGGARYATTPKDIISYDRETRRITKEFIN